MNPAWHPIVAVDPGGRATGIVVRHRDRLHHSKLIVRGDPAMSFDFYLQAVIDAVTKARDVARINTVVVPVEARYSSIPLAVEDLTDPNPHMGLTSLRGLIDTAQVIGAIAGQWIIIRIPPGGHGSGPLAAYPKALIGEREKRGAGQYRHLRSAWDIAATARTLTRQRAGA